MMVSSPSLILFAVGENGSDSKHYGEKIAMLTAYDYSMARLIDEAGVDAILVGDYVDDVKNRDFPNETEQY